MTEHDIARLHGRPLATPQARARRDWRDAAGPAFRTGLHIAAGILVGLIAGLALGGA